MGRLCPSFNQNKHSRYDLVKKSLCRTIPPVPVIPLFLNLLALLPSALLPGTLSARVPLDRIVAEVGPEIILDSEIQKKLQHGPRIQVSEFPATADSPDHEKALQDAINLQLLLNYAKEIDLTVTDEDVEQYLPRMMKHHGISSKAELRRMVEKEGVSYASYLEDTRVQLLRARFEGRVIMPAVKQITNKEIITAFLEKNADQTESVKLQLRSITIPLPAQSGSSVRQAKKQHAQEIYTKIKEGMDFFEAEKLYSGGSHQQKAAELTLSELHPVIRDAVSPLSQGQFTSPLELGDTIYIFYLEDRKIEKNSRFEEQRAEIAAELRRQKIENQLKLWLKEERLKHKIRIIRN